MKRIAPGETWRFGADPDYDVGLVLAVKSTAWGLEEDVMDVVTVLSLSPYREMVSDVWATAFHRLVATAHERLCAS